MHDLDSIVENSINDKQYDYIALESGDCTAEIQSRKKRGWRKINIDLL